MAAELLNVPFVALNDTCMGLTHCSLVTPSVDITVRYGSGNGLMPDSIKPLPEPMLNSHL